MTHSDVIIVGAGPCGLFQAFQLGLQGLRCQLIEALPFSGGQCTELYPDKPIYDIPGVPVLDAKQLRDQLEKQLKPFSPVIHFNQTVDSIESNAEGSALLNEPSNEPGLTVTTSAGLTLQSRYVVIATGAGAFTPVKLRTEGIEKFEDRQLFYGKVGIEHLQQKQAVVTGDTSAAIDTAIELASADVSTVLLHRKRRLQIDSDQQAHIAQLQQTNKLQLINGKILRAAGVAVLEALEIQLQSRDKIMLPTNTLIARLGNSPKNNKLEKWQLATQHNLINVDPTDFSTNRDAIYAVGDTNTYPGKRKLILCGFHEATLAAFAIAKRMQSCQPIHTLYTTTSTVLRQRLGVS